MQSRAQVVIIGCGVVGASTAYHLTELGCTDLLVVDQGPLFTTGGSSSHAPGLVFQANPSRTMTQLARHTVELYQVLDFDGQACYHPVGGIEVAATPERWHDLKRKYGLATSWGLEAELISPAEVVERIPLVDSQRIHGGLLVPSDGIAKSVRAVEAMGRAAQSRGARFEGETQVTGFDIADGRVRGVRTTRGNVEAETVLICAGIWGPKVGRLAGISIPVQPLGHQYARTTPVGALAGATQEVTHPILRHQDSSMYFRQVFDGYGVGSYQHRSLPVSAEDIPSSRRDAPGSRGDWQQMPSVMAFTADDFKQPWQDACELLPALRSTELADAMNGLFLFTSDGMPVLGESRDVRGLWVAEAVWVTHSGGIGRAMAEWIVEGKPSVDLREGDLHRFEAFAHSPAYVRARGSQNFQEVYDIIHPLQPMEEPRPLRTSPFYPRQQELGAYFLEASGWERPHWFESNTGLLKGQALDGQVADEREPWAARYWSPIVGAEARATRAAAALYDMTPLKRVEVSGLGALTFLQRLTTGEMDKAVGAVTYTLLLDERGGIRSDITVARLGDQRFQVGCNGPLDVDWLEHHRPADGSVHLTDLTSATCCLGLWGPRAREVLGRITGDDVSNDGLRFFRAKRIDVAEVPVTALRLSYVGELGWELYAPTEYGLRLWDLLWAAGQPSGLVAGGRGAFNALRVEKGYRSWGTDMWAEHNPYEAGLGFAVRMDSGDFVGREALLRAGTQPTRRLTCLVLDDPSKLVLGKEPVLADGRVVGFVTSAAQGYSVGQSIAYAWLPTSVADGGAMLEIEYFGQRYPARVAADPLFDPQMQRMRA
ncbi:MAG: FAD-dependent oxidoreductase [Actinomycetota bacterium]|nr:FAD-dependent oxidoreductase [Actinomycetota bacterium]